jgi:hypothetical protein
MPARPLLPRLARRTLVLAALCLPATARAQLISIKTVPLAEGDQYGFLPSANRGMGSASIALDDTLLDPFANPAKASRFRHTYFFGSPSFYSVSHAAGDGQTLPLGAWFRSGSTFGGVTVALQELSPSRRPGVIFAPGILRAAPLDISAAPAVNPAPIRSQNNRYAVAMLGRDFGGGLSLAASAFWSGLRMMDGVELLYPNSMGLRQSGHDLDFRVGMLKDWSADNSRTHSLEAVVVHNRFAMAHDVSYQSFFWDPLLAQPISVPRVEHNDDRTNTWGLHLKYDRPLADSGWRIGAIATGNLMSHPKIPNYEIVNIPRDPGRSSAYNLGIGVSQSHGPTTFGLDAIFEPIWSHTWADAADLVVTASGKTIPAGGHTIDNDFRFTNTHLRTGIAHVLPLEPSGRSSLQFQLGMQLHSIHYWLDQYDHVQEFGRGQDEHWTEWTRTWGMSFRFPTVEIHYRGYLTTGAGRPGVTQNGGVFAPGVLTASNFLLAPSGPVTLDPVSVMSHQFTISLPIR